MNTDMHSPGNQRHRDSGPNRATPGTHDAPRTTQRASPDTRYAIRTARYASRIGVFVCHCGINIAGTIDVQRTARAVEGCPGVVYATDYRYMCSDPGQTLIRDAIREHQLDGVVVAACSPSMHETTFRRAAEAAGLNPYRVEVANVREQCSWVHQEASEEATHKAISIIASVVAKLRGDESLDPLATPIARRLLVIGGGIAGLTVALEVAEAGYEVILVEREAGLGGRLQQIQQTYVGLEPLAASLAERVEQVWKHPKIKVLTRSEVVSAGGFVGNFQVRVATVGQAGDCFAESAAQKPGRHPERGEWVPAPTSDSPLETGILRCAQDDGAKDAQDDGAKDAAQAASACAHGPEGPCTIRNDSPMVEANQTFGVGAIVVATGFGLLPVERLGEYGGGRVPDVIDALEFERLLAEPVLRRPSDGRVPQRVAFVQCAGSRDPERGLPYCSKICCMYTAKQAVLYRQRVPEGQAVVFYIDLRSAGRRYEEFAQQAMEEGQVLYLRGKVAKVFREGDQVRVWGADTLSGRNVELSADLVVLAAGAVPSAGAAELGRRLRATTDALGFFNEAHPKLRPVESLTAGIYLAGAAQAPKDIPETVSQAGAAAAKVLSLFSRRELVQEPTVATVLDEVCAGCGLCVAACPYEARQLNERLHIAEVNPALCQGCGACVTACPNKACVVRNWRPEQMLAMVEAALGDRG